MAFVLRRLVPLVLVALLWAPAAYAWSWPVPGPVLQEFSFDSTHPYAAGQHRGVDIGSSAGDSVLAPADGTVTFAGSVPTNGRSVTIETSDGYSVTLTHLGTLLVSRGAAVVEGDAVGTVGPSGTPEVDVPYVHLGIRVASDPEGYLDPLTLLPPLDPPAPPEVSAAPAPADSSAPPAQTEPAAAPVPGPAASSGAASQQPVAAPVASVRALAVGAAAPASAPVAAPVVSAPAAVPVAGARTAPTAHVARARASRPVVRHSRPEPARVHVRLGRPAANEVGVGSASVDRRPRPDLREPEPTRVRHRPVPLPAPVRERPAAPGRVPVVPLALGAGVAAMVLLALSGLLRLRRRPAASPEPGGVVIRLPQRTALLEERRVA